MDFLAAIRRESELFYATADTTDATLRVPSCPDWNVTDLVWHLGEVHWFWTEIIATRASDPDAAEAAKPPRPADHAELVAWGRAQANRLIETLQSTPEDTAVWTWAMKESDHNVHFILRHQVQEAAVHRWDMQNAASRGSADPIDPETASDSLDEFLSISLPWSVNAEKPIDGTVHLHCTDTEGEWFIHPDGRVEPIHAKGDVAVRGTASDLLLALHSRIPLDALELIGNAALATRMFDAIDLG